MSQKKKDPSKFVTKIITEHRLNVKKEQKEKKKEKPFSLSVLSMASTSGYHNFKIINDYLKAFIKTPTSRLRLIEHESLTKKVIEVFLKNEFEFIDIKHLLKFGSICIKKKIIKSNDFLMLVISAYFHVFTEFLGNPTFKCEKILKELISLIDLAKKSNSSIYFDAKIFSAFRMMFIKNKLIYLEDEKIIENIFIFLFEFYDQFIQEFFLLIKNSQINKMNKFSKFLLPNFSGVLHEGLKPAFVIILIKNNKFQNLMKSFVEKSNQLFKIIKKVPISLITFVADVLKVNLILIRYKSLSDLFLMKTNTLIFKYLHLVLIFFKFQFYDQLENFVGFISPTIKDVLKKSQFTSLQLDSLKNNFSEINEIYNSKVFNLDPKFKKIMKKNFFTQKIFFFNN